MSVILMMVLTPLLVEIYVTMLILIRHSVQLNLI